MRNAVCSHPQQGRLVAAVRAEVGIAEAACPDDIMPKREGAVGIVPEDTRDAVAPGGEGLSGPAAEGAAGGLGGDSAVGGKLPEAEAGVGVGPKKLGQVVAADRNGDRLGGGVDRAPEQAEGEEGQQEANHVKREAEARKEFAWCLQVFKRESMKRTYTLCLWRA